MTLAIVLLLAFSTIQGMKPAPGTYAITTDANGIVRMDTRTGEAARCRIVDAAMRCEPMAKQAEAVSRQTEEK